MNSPVDEIKKKLDILEVVQGYVKLTRAGASWKGLCPFHAEKTPSFIVSPEKQMWYCFGCSEGGDMFTFIEKIEGVEFADALRMLAEKAGVELRPEDKVRQTKKKKLFEICELATQFFEKQLESSSTGKKAVKYLKRRGIKEPTIQSWRLGFAPDTWEGLSAFLQKKGYSDREIESTGLSLRGEALRPGSGQSKYHDRFRHRIMFPLFDVQGNVVGFSGRLFDEVPSHTAGKEAGKYINTPNTSLYDKSRMLYGLDRARGSIKEEKEAVLVEGNLDVIAAHQAGTTHVVASCGTALGEEHLRILKRYTDQCTFCFDTDVAGEKATKKSAHAALALGLSVNVILLPGKDAAEVIMADSRKWEKAIKEKVGFIDFVIASAKEKHSLKSAEGKKAFAHEVLPAVASLPSPVEREHWIHEVGGMLGSAEGIVRQEMEQLAVSDHSYAPVGAVPLQAPVPLSLHALEEYFLILLVRYPEGKLQLSGSLDFISNEQVRAVLRDLAEGRLEDLKGREDLRSVIVAAELLPEIMPLENLSDEFIRVHAYLKFRYIKERLRGLEGELRRAEHAKDDIREAQLLSEFRNLSQELLHYEKEKSSKF